MRGLWKSVAKPELFQRPLISFLRRRWKRTELRSLQNLVSN